MNIGVGLPTSTAGISGQLLVDWARRADAGPFSSLGVVDRVAYQNYEPFTALGAAYLLPRVIGLGRASELLLLGETVTAQRALAIGLANAVVEDSELSAQTSSVARRLAEGPALAYAATKMLISKQMDMSLGAALELDSMTQALLMKSADHAEFYAAFREGREPNWTGR